MQPDPVIGFQDPHAVRLIAHGLDTAHRARARATLDLLPLPRWPWTSSTPAPDANRSPASTSAF